MIADSNQIIKDAKIGKGTRIMHYVNLYGCEIGKDCMIGPFVEIQSGVRIGNRVRIQSHSFLCTGVTLEDEVFISHGVMFVNDIHPPHYDPKMWKPITVRRRAVIGSNATILPVEIGRGSLIGAGSVVTRNVPPNTIVAGNPAKPIRKIRHSEVPSSDSRI